MATSYNSESQERATAEYIYQLFITQSIAFKYENYNIIYDTTEGLHYSTGENFVNILPYFITYMKRGDVDTDGQSPKKYIEKINKESKPQNGKIWLFYVDSRSNYRGHNVFGKVDKETFKKEIHLQDDNLPLQLACLKCRMSATIS